MGFLQRVRRAAAANTTLDYWSVGVSTSVDPWDGDEITWLDDPSPSAYWADPFGRWHDGRLHVLVERYDYREPVGRIVALTVEDREVVDHGVVLDIPGHASYPFLIEDDGEIFCVPESSADGEVALFWAVEFPHRWERVTRLLDFGGVDNTVFHHEGRWWMLNVSTRDGGRSELHAWHADALTGPWQPHRGNPVKRDRASSRPGGTPWLDDGVVVRPAQNCVARYGSHLEVCRVDRLTPTDFSETVVTTIGPSASSPFAASHTYSRLAEGGCIIDAATTQFVLASTANVAYAAGKLRSLAGRAPAMAGSGQS